MDLTGTVLGDRYEIEELIGSGGMARVYKAHCNQLNRTVAIKVLRDELKDDTEFVGKFKTEALAAASLTHPNIVSVFDSGVDNGVYYFVMEYVDGYTLKQYIARKGALDWKEASDITLGICAAIEQAHKNNIVHRDIKPHNIMINSDGVVKVTDFGIARAVSSSTIVRGGNIIGSVHYFSPEQAKGEATTFKSDIYSIGVVFYEMLTGRVPFDAADPFSVAKMHVEKTPIEPKRMNNNIPSSINNVVMRALSKRPEERFSNVTEMIEAIKRAVSAAEAETEDMPEEIVTDDFDDTIQVPVVNSTPEKKVKNKNDKRDNSSALLGVLIGAIIIALIFGAYALSGRSKVGSKKIDDFVGKDFEQIAEQYEDEEKYIIEIEEETESDEYDEGVIIDQNPKAGSRYSEADLPIKILVTVSKGSGEIMEDYIGDDGTEVEYKLSKEGYKVEIKERDSDEYEEGQVIRTLPNAGSTIKKGERIVLYVSSGSDDKKEDKKSTDTNNSDSNNTSSESNENGNSENSHNNSDSSQSGGNSTASPSQSSETTQNPNESSSQGQSSTGQTENRGAYEGL